MFDFKKNMSVWLSPVVFLALALIVWELILRTFSIPPYILPSPLAVAQSGFDNTPKLLSAFFVTGAAALLGLACSVITGIFIGTVFAFSPIVRAGGYPYAIFLQTVPVVAIAPIIITWFGYGFQSVVVVAFVISLFPIITATTNGMLSVDQDLIDFFRLYHAKWWQTLLKLRLPHATRFIMTGLKTSGGLAVVGAIVGEYFAGHDPNRQGLGYYIFVAHGQLKTGLLYAAVLTSTLLGISMFAGINFIASTLLKRWYDAGRNEST